MVRGEALGDRTSAGQLVVGLLLEADREGLDGLRRCRRHLGDNDGGIHAAREECPERDVGDHPSPDGCADETAKLLLQLAHGLVALSRVVEAPVAL